MRSVPVLAAVALGAVLTASGCGQQHTGTPAGGPLASHAPALPSLSPVSHGSNPPSAACHPGAPPAPGNTLVLGNADNGRTVCVPRGTAVTVYLKGTPASRWAIVRANPRVLEPHANGHLMLALGVTGASFVAIRPGTTVVTSSRPACGPSATPGTGAAPGGTFECGALLAFHVTVKVMA